jgi:hypothetical protein
MRTVHRPRDSVGEEGVGHSGFGPVRPARCNPELSPFRLGLDAPCEVGLPRALLSGEEDRSPFTPRGCLQGEHEFIEDVLPAYRWEGGEVNRGRSHGAILLRECSAMGQSQRRLPPGRYRSTMSL